METYTLVTLAAPQSPAAAAYRALRINLTYASLDTPLETLVVSSPAPEKGDAAHLEVAANLAVVMAQAGQQVILVDADLRRPRLHDVFDVPNAGGLTQIIVALEGQLLEQLQERADVVILLAPPVTAAVDAAALGAKTDGLLLAVRSGHTRRDHIEEAKELLERFHVNLLGAVLTAAPGGKPSWG
jgi:non-specific protein-tyrosine kinase